MVVVINCTFVIQEYWQFKEDLIATERAMLTRLGFHVNCEHPHKFILSYLRALHAEKNAYNMACPLPHTLSFFLLFFFCS